ncbi:cell wall-binding repeat-containing protein [Mesobacillus subterraneus]|uniref:cell wall-binding repeat-containing protein n=1 Tax=Mesobacillus subterraneus TaxID=285983 RepID=UPI00203FBD94|nr:cell wall-binding repeat-containing protein [Mesobacillus subterraneus]MCM3663660.1 cell wall-binding repeat-containing protein [Mesobacillus subterraneus]MCM3683425.1 cell wall-binding repeat-containing protein [Mesobacillus subterraneus]
MFNVRLFATAFLLTVASFVFLASQSFAAPYYERISGVNRIETSVEISRAGWETADNVILARADNPADALSSASLSGAADAPILLTSPNSISDVVLDEIDRLGASTVYILGGKGAISPVIEEELISYGFDVIRLGGSTRFDTAALINKEAGGAYGTKAIVVNGYAVADALSASSNSAINQIPIYLSKTGSLPVNLPSTIKEVTIYGGTGVVSTEVETLLKKQGKTVTRIAGNDRYLTNIAAADPSLAENVIIVRGTSTSRTSEQYPDAVAGAGLSHKLGANIILSHPTSVKPDVQEYFMNNRYFGYFILGGEGAVTSETVMELTFHPDSEVLETFDHNIIASAMDPNKPVLYSLSDDDNSIRSYNLTTGEEKSIQLKASPEQLYIENNKIYVSIVHGLHDDYNFGVQSGEIAIIDAGQFKLEKTFEIDLDPFDLVVDKNGFIYVSGGSAQWTEIKSYSSLTGAEVSVNRIRQQSYLEMNPNQTKVYAINTDLSPRDISEYYISNGVITGYKDSPYHGEYDLGDFSNFSDIKASPDGKYLFNSYGHVFKGNLEYAAELEVPYNDVAFDLGQNRFYSGIGGYVFRHNYSDFLIDKYYLANGEILYMYQKDGQIYVLSIVNVGLLEKFAIEKIDMTKGTDLESEEQSFQATDALVDTISKSPLK